MLLGVIADDFTGASDIANTLAKGRRAMAASWPSSSACPAATRRAGIEAGVVALKTRSIPAGEAVAQSPRRADWLQRPGLPADSSSNIARPSIRRRKAISARSAEALADALGAPGVVACPAFPAAGRTVYQGHLFVGDRLLNQSGHGEPSAQPDDRPRHPPLAARASRAAGRPPRLAPWFAAARPPSARRLPPTRPRTRGSSSSTPSPTATSSRSARRWPRPRSSPAAPASPLACRRTSSRRSWPAASTAFAGVAGPEASSPDLLAARRAARSTRTPPATRPRVDRRRGHGGRHRRRTTSSASSASEGRSPIVYSSADPEAVAAAAGAPRPRARRRRHRSALRRDGERALSRAAMRRLVVAGGETVGRRRHRARRRARSPSARRSIPACRRWPRTVRRRSPSP